MKKIFILIGSHSLFLAAGFILGLYLLPILTATKAPEQQALVKTMEAAKYKGEFTRDLNGSDLLHWGEGEVSVSRDHIAHKGRLSPGPDYKLYLVPTFVENEEEFLAIKSEAKYVSDIKGFHGFIVDVPKDINVSQYSTLLVWCESFSEFITSTQYKNF